MTPNESKNELKVMVLSDLAEICKKLAEHSDVPKALRAQAAEFVTKFNSLVPYRGKGNASQHFQGEQLIVQIALFLPKILEIHSWPADAPSHL